MAGASFAGETSGSDVFSSDGTSMISTVTSGSAVASVAGTLFGLADSWEPIRPFPIIQMHGTAEERFVPYNGRGDIWSVQKTLEYWLDNNQCTALADTFSFPDIVPSDNCTVQKISWRNCSDESIVIHYKIFLLLSNFL